MLFGRYNNAVVNIYKACYEHVRIYLIYRELSYNFINHLIIIEGKPMISVMQLFVKYDVFFMSRNSKKCLVEISCF